MHYAPIIARAGATVPLAELVGAFSYALDITEGQPPGHAVRCCWIGSHIGAAIGLGEAKRRDLHYALLLKDLGCSSNAARICELYQADDLAFKRGYKTVGTSLASTLHFVFSKTARQSRFGERAAAVGNILKNGTAIAQELILSRCTRGADIARTLGFSDAVCSGIYHLDEHWDGSGRPDGLKGDAIPLYSRIALLAQIVDVFLSEVGRAAAVDEAAALGQLARPRAGDCLRLCRALRRLLGGAGLAEHRCAGRGAGAGRRRDPGRRGFPRCDRRRLRPGGRRQEPVHRRPFDPRRRACAAHGAGARRAPRAPSLAAPRRLAPRHRQARRVERDP